MNILSLDLEYSQIFHILPSFGITLGKSIYISVHWLNFYLTLKHISTDYKAWYWGFCFPSMTINHYPESAYAYTFEINAFGYMYRKGLFKDKNKKEKPWDNTGEFVHSSWLAQFRPKNFDFMKGVDDLVKGVKEFIEESERRKE